MSVELDSKGLELLNRIEITNWIFKNSIVSFDIDGVEMDLISGAVDVFNRKFNQRRTKGEVTTYMGMVEWCKQAGSLDPLSDAREIFDDKELIKNALPESGSLLLSNYLNLQGIHPLRITSRPAPTRSATVACYRARMPWVNPGLIIQQVDGDEIGTDFKVKKIKELGVKYHFEDSAEHTQRIIDETSATVILIPQPWNEDYINNKKHDPRILIPIKDWQTPAKLVQIYTNLFQHL